MRPFAAGLVLAIVVAATGASGDPVGDLRIERVSLSHSGGVNSVLAMLALDRGGAPQTVLRTFDRENGCQVGTDAVLPHIEQDNVVPTDLRVSSVVSRGNVLVLTPDGRARVIFTEISRGGAVVPTGQFVDLPVARLADGSVRLAEMPHPTEDGRALVGVGTADGELHVAAVDISGTEPIVDGTSNTRVSLGELPVDDLEAVPQAGHFGFAGSPAACSFWWILTRTAGPSGCNPR